MRIIHHQRLPHEGQFSIERLFAGMRTCLPLDWNVAVAQSPHPSKGLLPRLRNLLDARRQEGDIHHIVGDAHYLSFALPREKTILTIHDCANLNRLGGLKRTIFKYLWYIGPMRRAAVVTTISETARKELERWVGPMARRVVVIPNCVRSEFVASPKPFNEAAPVVLQVGVGWNKNLERVAQALVGTHCVLDIIGKPSDVQLARLEESGVRYRVLGRVSDEELVEAYRRCDLVVFTSIYEGFGLPILEAQATGRPVITSNRSSMPEAAGEGALLVNPDSIDEIRAAVVCLCSDNVLRESLVSKGFENVAKYRPDAIAARYAEIYASLAAARLPARP
ncbi:MAG: glycosyltransferase family 4 protein [Verrucomicrobiales bacterium]